MRSMQQFLPMLAASMRYETASASGTHCAVHAVRNSHYKRCTLCSTCGTKQPVQAVRAVQSMLCKTCQHDDAARLLHRVGGRPGRGEAVQRHKQVVDPACGSRSLWGRCAQVSPGGARPPFLSPFCEYSAAWRRKPSVEMHPVALCTVQTSAQCKLPGRQRGGCTTHTPTHPP